MQTSSPLKRNFLNSLPLLCIVAVGAVLRFWKLSSLELQSDGAHYAFRALGWFDFLGTNTQTAPIVWFQNIPWWALLSFHDHPPLAFFVQHWFLQILGDTTANALLPFLLSGMANIILVYCIVKKHGTKTQALCSSFLIAILSYAIWTDRSGYLEGIEIPLILCSIYFFLNFTAHQRSRDLYLSVLAAGFAILTKYTAVFLLPVFITYIIWKQRRAVRLKKTVYTVTILLVSLSPIIIYNIAVFATRGHFDATLSSFLGMRPADFMDLNDRVANLAIIQNIFSMLTSLLHTVSLPLLIVFFLALGQTLVFLIHGRAKTLDRIMLLGITWIVLLFAFSGAAERHLAIIIPFISILVGMRVIEFVHKNLQARGRVFMITALIFVFSAEFLYSINTNLITRPFGTPGIAFSPVKMYRRGFQELDDYFHAQGLLKLGTVKKIRSVDDIQFDFDSLGENAIVVDQRLDWFSMMWYMNRYRFYYEKPYFIMYDLFAFALHNDYGTAVFTFLKDHGVKNVFFVYTTARIQPGPPGYDSYIDGILSFLKSQNNEPVKIINDYSGKPSFIIYKFSI